MADYKTAPTEDHARLASDMPGVFVRHVAVAENGLPWPKRGETQVAYRRIDAIVIAGVTFEEGAASE